MPRRYPPRAPVGHALLLGRLRVRRPRGAAPYLACEVHCYACNRTHFHGWPVEYGLTGIGHRTAHCGDPNSRLGRSGYFIGLSPLYDSESGRILARFPRRR